MEQIQRHIQLVQAGALLDVYRIINFTGAPDILKKEGIIMLWVIISVIVVAIDQLSKYIVVQKIEAGASIPVIDRFFYLTLHRNPGAAWGMLQDGRVFFLILVPVISAFIVYYMAKNNNGLLRFALALILGGAAGNYIDRLTVGKVTDFLLFSFGSYTFPIFNAADIAITCGTALLAIYVLFIYKEPNKSIRKDK